MKAWALPLAVAALCAGAMACVIEGVGASGKRCATANDCPEPLVCVLVRPGGRTCEALPPPTEGDFGGGTAYWCSEVEALMNTYCVSCHTVPPTGGAPANLRLDRYHTEDGGVPAAREKAERIYVRTVVFEDMPPLNSPQPTAAENAVLTAWFRSGAPFCADGPDAGADPDGGTAPDAGTADGG
jgi:hypothetical protein